MSLFRKLSIASVVLTIVGQLAGWGGADGTAETAAEVAMLVKAFSGTSASPQPARTPAGPRTPEGSDPAALLSALLK